MSSGVVLKQAGLKGALRDISLGERDGGLARDRIGVGILVALIYLIARPPLYERDGYVYHLLGRDFLGGTNPHHLLWNGIQTLITRADSLFGVGSVVPFQLVGMACGTASAVLLYQLLLESSGRRLFAAAGAIFVALAPWTWFMAFQNQPYALMFLLLIVFLNCFASSSKEMPRGSRFAVAAGGAVAMVMLQQAAVLIVAAAAVCFLVLAGARRALLWSVATGVPTAVLYVVFSLLKGVRSLPGFWQWVTAYLHSQHSLQTRFPDSLAQSVMGVISAFVNQEAFKEAVVDRWSASAILWFYGSAGICGVALVGWLVRRVRLGRNRPSLPAVAWISVATIASWALFCVLWEPTNYYWYILLAPCFVLVASTTRLTIASERAVVATLCALSIWNVAANHTLDAAGAERAPEPQMRAIAQHLAPNDLLWVVDLGWSGDIDYDLLASTAAIEHVATIRSIGEVVGASPDESGWQHAFLDSTRQTMARGGRVFVSDRIYDPDAFDQSWEGSPFADYRVERAFPIDWTKLERDLPTFIEGHFELRPTGFLIGSDTIWRLEPNDVPRR
jgi:hypothetical protein